MRSQLTDANITNIDGNPWIAEYIYHDNGDMASRTITGTAKTDFTYAGNLMDTATGGESFDLDYDENGNMKTGVSATLVYNWDSKLRSAEKGGDSISLKYDPSGSRIYKNSSEAGQCKYIVDIMGDLPVILLELDSSNNIKKTYIYANSQIIAQHDGNDSDPRYFYLHDRLGSVRQIINTSGNVKNMYTYEPFGEALEEQSGTGAPSNPFMFTGQYFDSEIEEYYLRARQYDPHIGRFTSRDPVFGEFQEPLSLHRYLYCLNDPTNRIDPEGLWFKRVHRTFGEHGFGFDEERGFALFDYARLDYDFPPTDFRYAGMHFRSREEILPDLISAAQTGGELEFAYFMHEWQDSYVHFDRFGGPPLGPLGHLARGTSVDDPLDATNIRRNSYLRCHITTLIWEDAWFRYSPDSIGSEDWLEHIENNPRPWLSTGDMTNVAIYNPLRENEIIYQGPLADF